jgi:hypothetical protein
LHQMASKNVSNSKRSPIKILQKEAIKKINSATSLFLQQNKFQQ